MIRIARIGESGALWPERGNKEDPREVREGPRAREQTAGGGEDREDGCGGGHGFSADEEDAIYRRIIDDLPAEFARAGSSS